MGTTFNSSDYLIKFDIETSDIEKKLRDYIDFLNSLEKSPQKRGSFTRKANKRTGSGRKSRSKATKTSTLILKRFFDKQYKKQIEAIALNISSAPSSHLGKQVKESAIEIRQNILERISQNFNTSRRLQNAIRDDRSFNVNFQKGKINVGIASISALNENTSIFVGNDSKPYEPPETYAITSWWIYQEFTGAERKTNFKTLGSEWYVRSQGWMPGFSARPTILFNSDLQEEDENVIEKIPLLVKETILNSIDRKRKL